MALPAGRYGVTKRQLNKIKNLPVNTIGMIEEVLEDSKQLLEDTIGWTGDNLIPLSLNEIKSVNPNGIWNGNEYTLYGVTYIPQLDNNGNVVAVLVNGTATEWSQFYLSRQITLPAGDYVLSSKNNIPSDVFLTYSSFGQGSALTNNENKKYVSVTTPSASAPYIGVQTTVENLVVYPVIRKLNVDEQKADNSVIAPVEDQATCQNPDGYAVGEHFIRNGAFCTVIQAISSGGNLTENTNYTSGQIGDVVYLSGSKSIAVGANGVAWTDFDDLVPFSNYDILGFSFRGGGGYIAMGCLTWVDSTDHHLRIVARNFDTESRSWVIEGYITVRVK